MTPAPCSDGLDVFMECVLIFNVFSQDFRNLDVFRQNLDTF